MMDDQIKERIYYLSGKINQEVIIKLYMAPDVRELTLDMSL